MIADEMGFVDGKASGVMCLCDLIYGVPNCASPALLNGKIWSEWGRENALVVSDCGVLGFTMGSPTNWDPEIALSDAFDAGVDLDTGNKGKDNFVFAEVVPRAIASGKLKRLDH